MGAALVLTIALLCWHFLVADLSEHISGKFAPEVTSGKVLCHLDRESVTCACVCVRESERWGVGG